MRRPRHPIDHARGAPPPPARALLRGALAALGPLLAAAAATEARAQTVSPPVVEYRERARGSFQLLNGSLFPLTVVLDVRGFEVTDRGDVIESPLDTGRIHVRLAAQSFRIPPRGSYTVFYEARADSLPAWFTIVSALSGARTDNGLNLRILLPHVVYLNQKQWLRKQEVVVRRLELDRAARKARVELENLGPNLGRVLDLRVAAGGGSQQPAAAFPLFPHRVRWAEVPWEHPEPPARVVVRFAKFTLDTTLTAVAAAPPPGGDGTGHGSPADATGPAH